MKFTLLSYKLPKLIPILLGLVLILISCVETQSLATEEMPSAGVTTPTPYQDTLPSNMDTMSNRNEVNAMTAGTANEMTAGESMAGMQAGEPTNGCDPSQSTVDPRSLYDL